MKKIVPFFLIVLALSVLTFASERLVDDAFRTLEDALYTTEASLHADDFDTALQTASECIAYFDSHERMLSFFMPTETLHLFEASIFGMETYIQEANRTEALAEAARAHAQLGAIWTVYFRMI